MYSGQHGKIRRARFAEAVTPNVSAGIVPSSFAFPSQGAIFDSLYNFRDASETIIPPALPNLLENPGFELGSQSWEGGAGVTFENDPTKAKSGSYYCRVERTTQLDFAQAYATGGRKRYPVSPGDVVRISGYLMREAGDGRVAIYAHAVKVLGDPHETQFPLTLAVTAPNGEWQLVSGDFTVQPGMAYVEFVITVGLNATQNTIARLDDLSLTIRKSTNKDRTLKGQSILLGDINRKLFAFDTAYSYASFQRFNKYVDPGGAGVEEMAGPWSRSSIFNLLFEMNGKVKQTARGSGATTIEGWGLDAPDASPAVNVAAGGITKTVGRSYSYAWENEGKSHVGPPSPATAFVAYQSQQGTIDCVQPGTITADGTTTIRGSGTAFSRAWIGKRLWIEGRGGGTVSLSGGGDTSSSGPATGGAGPSPRIVQVNSPTEMAVDVAVPPINNARFQVFDPQTTHVRLYATADGGATYFRVQRNVFNTAEGDISVAGLRFVDTDNSEPPQGNFTSEQAQFFNVPPPVGAAVYEYQSRMIIFRVPGAPHTLFYTNIELTTVGNPPEGSAPLNQITLPLRDAEIMGCGAVPTGLVVWSNRYDMFKITGLLTDNSVSGAVQLGASVQRLPYELGIASPEARVVTPLGLIWLTSDREVWLFTDQYAPRNIGRPVQDVLSTINPDVIHLAKMRYIHGDDRNWVVLAVPTGDATFNNTLLILDIDMLTSGGQQSFFVFDAIQSQPAWYVFSVAANAIEAVVDAYGYTHLMAGEFDRILDITYREGWFRQGDELEVPGFVTLHAIGNENADVVKRLAWVRFVTNRDPKDIQAEGWRFRVDAVDDDVYTFDNPKSLDLLPGVNSPSVGHSAAGGRIVQRSQQFSPAMFKTQGVKSVQGRRFLFTVNFPSGAGDFELQSIQLQLEPVRR